MEHQVNSITNEFIVPAKNKYPDIKNRDIPQLILKIMEIDLEKFKDYIECLKICEGAKSLADYGAGHCKYSIIAKEKDFKVTAIDGRIIRIPVNIGFEFIHADVTYFKPNHDIILLSGILYHLDLGQQLEMLTRIANSNFKYIILNSHYLILENGRIKNDYPIGELLNFEGITGAHYLEGELDSLKNRPLASLYNKYSFWHTQESLINFVEKMTGSKCIKMFEPFTVDRRFFLFRR